MSTLRMLNDNVLVEPVETSGSNESSIILPDSAKKKSNRGIVKAIGPGGRDSNGTVIPMTLRIGDKVLYRQWAGSEVEIDSKKFTVMRESDVLGVEE